MVPVLVAVGCSAVSDPQESGPTSQSPNVSTTSAATTGVHIDAADYSLTVTPEQGARDHLPQVSEVPAPPAPDQDYLEFVPRAVEIEYQDGSQPDRPLALRFDMSADPDFAATGELVPAVVAVSDDIGEPEILRSQWDPDTRILTATTSHLSTFVPSLIDPMKVLRRAWTATLGFLEQAYPRPDCVGEAATVGTITYTLDPPSVPATWPCIRSDNGAIVIDLHSNSPNGYRVSSTPNAAEQVAQSEGSVAGAMDTVLYENVFTSADGSGTYLTPGGTTTLTYDPKRPPQRVTLGIDAGMNLIRSGIVGLQVLNPTSKLLDIPGVVTCVHTLAEQSQYRDDPTGAAYGNLSAGLAECIDVASQNLSLKPETPQEVANASTVALISLVPDLLSNLFANIRGGASGLTGESVQTLEIRTSQDSPVDSAGAMLELSVLRTASGFGYPTGPNSFRVSDTSKHDGRYYADINFEWTINRPAGSDLGYCRGHVQIVNGAGAEIAQWDEADFNACHGGGGWSTNTEISDAGTYTVNAQVEMERGPTLTGSQQFTVDY